MTAEGPGREVRYRDLAFLAFLFVFWPLDTWDADALDTFESSIVRTSASPGEEAGHTVRLPVVTVRQAVSAAGRCDVSMLLLEPVCAFVAMKKPFNLPRSDNPHIIAPPPVKGFTRPFFV